MVDDPNVQKKKKKKKSECPAVWIRLPRHQWPKTSQIIQDLDVPLDRNLYGLPSSSPPLLPPSPPSWQDCSVRVRSRTSCLNSDGRRLQPGNVSSFIGNKDSFYPCTWTTSRRLGRSTISNSRYCITSSKEKSWKRLENGPTFALKSSSNAVIWHASHIFCGLRKSFQEQSQKWTEACEKKKRCACLISTSTTRFSSGNSVALDTLLNKDGREEAQSVSHVEKIHETS